MRLDCMKEDTYGFLTNECGFQQFPVDWRRPLGRHSRDCVAISTENLCIIRHRVQASRVITGLQREGYVSVGSTYKIGPVVCQGGSSSGSTSARLSLLWLDATDVGSEGDGSG